MFRPFPSQLKPLRPNQLTYEFLEFRANQLNSIDSKEVFPGLEVLLNLQFLASKESSLESKYGENDFVFGLTMASLSPLYRRIIDTAAKLKIEAIPTMKARHHFLSTFDPLMGQAQYPDIKSGLRWYAAQKPQATIARDMRNLLKFNFAVHHEVLHAILSILVVPPRSRAYFVDYLLLLESLVFSFEFYLPRDFGPQWSMMLFKLNSTYRDFDAFDENGKQSGRDFFIGVLLSLLASLKDWSPSEIKRRFPESITGVRKQFAFKKEFLGVTNQWLGEYQKKHSGYPKGLLKWQSKSFKKLKLNAYRFEDLIKNEEELDRIWQWMNSTFGLSAENDLPRG